MQYNTTVTTPLGKIPKKTRIAILGDLHFEESEAKNFYHAREQILSHSPDILLSLGDLGGYSHPGTYKSFCEGKEYLESFNIPFYTLLGNHDLEGAEFQNDADNIHSWLDVFGYTKSYQEILFNGIRILTLSTEAFRQNPASAHEVSIHAEQLGWIKNKLSQPFSGLTIVASHAPILGSGIRVLQNLHLKVPNAWVNHTQNPGELYTYQEACDGPLIWLSAHNHMGQGYPDSLVQKGNHYFVHTGVIGSISRDGQHCSRLINLEDENITIHTIDHDKSIKTLESTHVADPPMVQHKYFPPPQCPTPTSENTIEKSVFKIVEGNIVEWDLLTHDAIGVVCENSIKFQIINNTLIVDFENGKRKILLANTRTLRFGKVYFPNPHKK